VDADVDVPEHRLRVPHAGDGVEREPRRCRPKGRHLWWMVAPERRRRGNGNFR
jgi:hypothetical protein